MHAKTVPGEYFVQAGTNRASKRLIDNGERSAADFADQERLNMTMIVQGFTTKKHMKEAIAAGDRPTFTDPSFDPSWMKFGKAKFSLLDVPVGQSFIVTNHPKRSWFAEIRRVGTDSWKVM